MKNFIAKIQVDEKILAESIGQDLPTGKAVLQEFGWLRDSGIYLDEIKAVEKPEKEELKGRFAAKAQSLIDRHYPDHTVIHYYKDSCRSSYYCMLVKNDHIIIVRIYLSCGKWEIVKEGER